METGCRRVLFLLDVHKL